MRQGLLLRDPSVAGPPHSSGMLRYPLTILGRHLVEAILRCLFAQKLRQLPGWKSRSRKVSNGAEGLTRIGVEELTTL
jgi:hypothetical protein